MRTRVSVRNRHTLNLHRWCDRLWLACCGNAIVIFAPSLLALLALSVRQAWRSRTAGLTVHDIAAGLNLKASAVQRLLTTGEHTAAHFAPNKARF
jgi:hypothetical protein